MIKVGYGFTAAPSGAAVFINTKHGDKVECLADIIIKTNSGEFEFTYFSVICQGSFLQRNPKRPIVGFINDIDCQGWNIQYACSCKKKLNERIIK